MSIAELQAYFMVFKNDADAAVANTHSLLAAKAQFAEQTTLKDKMREAGVITTG